MENIKKYSEYNVSESLNDPKYPELDEIAEELASEFSAIINNRTRNISSEMPYRAQYVLEEVIKKLQERV
jgi:hypothetical protein